MTDLTRNKLNDMAVWGDPFTNEQLSSAITQLLRQLDAANARADAAATTPPDVAQAARVLLDDLDSEPSIRPHTMPLWDAAFKACGEDVVSWDRLYAALRALAGETP